MALWHNHSDYQAKLKCIHKWIINLIKIDRQITYKPAYSLFICGLKDLEILLKSIYNLIKMNDKVVAKKYQFQV